MRGVIGRKECVRIKDTHENYEIYDDHLDKMAKICEISSEQQIYNDNQTHSSVNFSSRAALYN
jgi:hypothetical protein